MTENDKKRKIEIREGMKVYAPSRTTQRDKKNGTYLSN